MYEGERGKLLCFTYCSPLPPTRLVPFKILLTPEGRSSIAKHIRKRKGGVGEKKKEVTKIERKKKKRKFIMSLIMACRTCRGRIYGQRK